MTSLPSSSTAPCVPVSRNLILKKIDAVVLRIINTAQFRTHKYFRVSVPHAITGQGLIQHIQEALSSDDSGEAVADGNALHFATMLLHFGYLFPVIDTQAQSVKDDNTLYRVQLPYFWPSHVPQADNVEYAIYLTKRLMRNEQKHGLEQEEIDSYNKLVELLGHMWSFITTQAELQLKAQKEKKKADKVVFDSEERAFWRLRQPGKVNPAFEESVHKLERRIRKSTVQNLRLTLERLRHAVKTKPWLKVIKASETMTNWSEQFHEYDPFLYPSQPSNPWISDDTSLWVLNADNVEVPTERRVKRWGLSVLELVRDPIGRQVLESFLDSEFSSENLRFWMSIQDLKFSPNSQIETKAQFILDEFLAAGAPCQVNVDSRTLEETLRCLNESDAARRFAFSLSEEHVFTLMSKDSYPRFLRSNIYKGVLDAAKAKGKKRIFDVIKELSGSAVSTAKKTPISQKHHKMSRSSGADAVELGSQHQQQQQPHSSLNSGPTTLPKQFSSDSLPLKTSACSSVSPSLQLPNATAAGTTVNSATGGGSSPTSKDSKK